MLKRLVESRRFHIFMMSVVVINSILLGIEVSFPRATFIPYIHLADTVCVVFYVFELAIKSFSFTKKGFRKGWYIFDVLIVSLSILSPWRALASFRIFHLFYEFPVLQRLIMTMIHALPNLGGTAVIFFIFFYVYGIIATASFGEMFPEFFGHMGRSMYTLFQIMTLESWAMELARPIGNIYPWAFLYFFSFIIITAYILFNLIVGVIVSAAQNHLLEHKSNQEDKKSD